MTRGHSRTAEGQTYLNCLPAIVNILVLNMVGAWLKFAHFRDFVTLNVTFEYVNFIRRTKDTTYCRCLSNG